MSDKKKLEEERKEIMSKLGKERVRAKLESSDEAIKALNEEFKFDPDVTRGEEYNHYNIHLWDDNGYSVEEFQNYGYVECQEAQATHRGLGNEPLKKIFNWDRNTPNMHYADHNKGNIHTKFFDELLFCE